MEWLEEGSKAPLVRLSFCFGSFSLLFFSFPFIRIGEIFALSRLLYLQWGRLDTIQHLFFDCPFVCNYLPILHHHLQVESSHWPRDRAAFMELIEKGSDLLMLSCYAIFLWSLWNLRNNIKHNNACILVSSEILSFTCRSCS